MKQLRHERSINRRRGFSMVEAVVAVLITGLVLVAALNCIGATRRAQAATLQRSTAAWLAESLLQEIADTPMDASPTQPGRRIGFPTAISYGGLIQAPPLSPNGSPIHGTDDCRREVSVMFVEPDDLVTPVGVDSGLIRVRVSVFHKNRLVAERTGFKSRAGLFAGNGRGNSI